MRFGIRSLLFAIALLSIGLAWWFCPQATRLTHTGRELDLALVGPGYFQIQDVNTKEWFYTRHCSLIMNATGQLAIGRANEWMLIAPNITIPMDANFFEFGRDGTVRIGTHYTGKTMLHMGALSVTRFLNPGELREVKPDLFVPTDSSGVGWTTQPDQAGAGYVLQGWLEKGKVPGDPIDQFDLLRWAFVAALVWLVYQVSIMRRQLDLLQAGRNEQVAGGSAERLSNEK